MNPFYEMAGWGLVAGVINKPVFVVGAGRSGTSLLLQALGKHPGILAAEGEAPFLTSIGGNAALFDDSKTGEYYKEALKTDPEYLLHELRRLGFETAFGPYYGVRAILKRSLRNRQPPWRKSFWAAKTFPSRRVAGGLMKVYPEARFLYILRNGLDVVHSMTRFSGFRHDTFESHCQAWLKGVADFRYLEDHPRAVKIKQEDLLENPGACFQGIFEFLGLDYSDEPARYAATTLVHPLDQDDRRVSDVRAVLTRRKPGWATWNDEQREIFRTQCAVAMTEEGYSMPF